MIAVPRPRPRPRVAIVGAGFGGLKAAHLLGAGADIVLIDRDNDHGFWPLLYQVATAALAPEDIAHRSERSSRATATSPCATAR